MSKGKEVAEMVFIADNKFSEILQPSEESFDFPSSAISSQNPAILSGCFAPVLFMGLSSMPCSASS